MSVGEFYDLAAEARSSSRLRLLLLRRNREHRAGSDVEEPLRDAPEEEPLERPKPARSDDDEVRPASLALSAVMCAAFPAIAE